MAGSHTRGRILLLAAIQRAVIQKPPSLTGTLVGVAAAVVLPTLVRMALNPLLGSTLWFPTYYPATLIATLFLGWRAGVVVVLLSATIAGYFFIPPQFGATLDKISLTGMLIFMFADGLIVLTAGLLRTALGRLEAANQMERRLNAELQHRVKNTLSIVQAVVHQTAKRNSDPKDFQVMLDGRIAALSQAHNLLSEGRWEMCELPTLAQRALRPFQNGRTICINGPTCAVGAESCVPLVLILHELATNACKYGSLSVSEGVVDLTWDIEGDRVVLRWLERNGPPVAAPTRRGLGSALVTAQKGLHSVRLEYRTEGVQCLITVDQQKRKDARNLLLNPAEWKAV